MSPFDKTIPLRGKRAFVRWVNGTKEMLEVRPGMVIPYEDPVPPGVLSPAASIFELEQMLGGERGD